MKKLFLVALLLFSISQTFLFGQSTLFEFPVKRGTPEWDNLKSYEEKRIVCQIPAEKIALIPTSSLLDIYLDYPLLGDVMVFSSHQEGFNKLRINFNAVNELISRKDLSTTLIKKYKELMPYSLKNLSNFSRGEYSFRIQAIEIFLCQDEVLSNLSQNNRRELLESAIDHLSMKSQNQDLYALNSQYMSGWLNLKLFQIEKLKFNLSLDESERNFYIQDGIFPQRNIIGEIIKIGNSYLERR